MIIAAIRTRVVACVFKVNYLKNHRIPELIILVKFIEETFGQFY